MTALQVRNVPGPIGDILKRRAAAAGQSLSEYALGILEREAGVPTLAELTERIERRGRVAIEADPAALLRQDRSEH
ncbi:MAG: hypothetical protein LBG60_16575 [Bifidobacteriaceae bacterium]|jgi:plasmid stability protein|nr:hypothetical protein [Bifidobacteriaceae bacterium]